MKPIEISCRLELLPGETVRQQFENARQFGFDGVSLPGRCLHNWLKPLREYLPDCPLPRTALSLGFESSLLHPDPVGRTKCRDSLVRLMDIAADLGVQKLNVAPVLICDNPLRIEGEDARKIQDDLLCEQLPEMGDHARERKLLLLIEPVNRYESDYLHSIVHASQICAEIAHPNIALTADFFHMQIEELNPADALIEAGPYIGFVHVAENTRVEPGVGSLDFKANFEALRKIGYTGGIEIESRSLSGPAGEVLPKSASFLRHA